MPLDVSDQTDSVFALAGKAFAGYANLVAAAGQFTWIQLWNPVGSGITCRITRATPFTTSAGQVTFLGIQYSTQLAGSATAGVNKLNGGAAAKATVISFSNPSVTAPPFLFQGFWSGSAMIPNDYIPKGPIILPPGNGFVIGCQNAATQFGISYEWLEL